MASPNTLVNGMLRDHGFEVIFTNFLIAEEILSAALQEDVDVIGISRSSGGHMPVFDDLLAGMRKQGLDDVLLVGRHHPAARHPHAQAVGSRGGFPVRVGGGRTDRFHLEERARGVKESKS
jgi:methylmalonyl-CoA mutase cobalamin-binding domain/chain